MVVIQGNPTDILPDVSNAQLKVQATPEQFGAGLGDFWGTTEAARARGLQAAAQAHAQAGVAYQNMGQAIQDLTIRLQNQEATIQLGLMTEALQGFDVENNQPGGIFDRQGSEVIGIQEDAAERWKDLEEAFAPLGTPHTKDRKNALLRDGKYKFDMAIARVELAGRAKMEADAKRKQAEWAMNEIRYAASLANGKLDLNELDVLSRLGAATLSDMKTALGRDNLTEKEIQDATIFLDRDAAEIVAENIYIKIAAGTPESRQDAWNTFQFYNAAFDDKEREELAERFELIHEEAAIEDQVQACSAWGDDYHQCVDDWNSQENLPPDRKNKQNEAFLNFNERETRENRLYNIGVSNSAWDMVGDVEKLYLDQNQMVLFSSDDYIKMSRLVKSDPREFATETDQFVFEQIMLMSPTEFMDFGLDGLEQVKGSFEMDDWIHLGKVMTTMKNDEMHMRLVSGLEEADTPYKKAILGRSYVAKANFLKTMLPAVKDEFNRMIANREITTHEQYEAIFGGRVTEKFNTYATGIINGLWADKGKPGGKELYAPFTDPTTGDRYDKWISHYRDNNIVPSRNMLYLNFPEGTLDKTDRDDAIEFIKEGREKGFEQVRFRKKVSGEYIDTVLQAIDSGRITTFQELYAAFPMETMTEALFLLASKKLEEKAFEEEEVETLSTHWDAALEWITSPGVKNEEALDEFLEREGLILSEGDREFLKSTLTQMALNPGEVEATWSAMTKMEQFFKDADFSTTHDELGSYIEANQIELPTAMRDAYAKRLTEIIKKGEPAFPSESLPGAEASYYAAAQLPGFRGWTDSMKARRWRDVVSEDFWENVIMKDHRDMQRGTYYMYEIPQYASNRIREMASNLVESRQQAKESKDTSLLMSVEELMRNEYRRMFRANPNMTPEDVLGNLRESWEKRWVNTSRWFGDDGGWRDSGSGLIRDTARDDEDQTFVKFSTEYAWSDEELAEVTGLVNAMGGYIKGEWKKERYGSMLASMEVQKSHDLERAAKQEIVPIAFVLEAQMGYHLESAEPYPKFPKGWWVDLATKRPRAFGVLLTYFYDEPGTYNTHPKRTALPAEMDALVETYIAPNAERYYTQLWATEGELGDAMHRLIEQPGSLDKYDNWIDATISYFLEDYTDPWTMEPIEEGVGIKREYN